MSSIYTDLERLRLHCVTKHTHTYTPYAPSKILLFFFFFLLFKSVLFRATLATVWETPGYMVTFYLINSIFHFIFYIMSHLYAYIQNVFLLLKT